MKSTAYVVLGLLLGGVASCDRIVDVGEGPTDSGAHDASSGTGGSSGSGGSDGSGGATVGGSGGAATGSGGAGGTTTGSGGTTTGAGGSAGSSGPGGAGGSNGEDASAGSGGMAGGFIDAAVLPEGAVPADAPPTRPLACSGAAGTPWIDDQSEGGTFAQYYTGQWLLCSAAGFLGTTDEVGLEIDYRGSWYKLYVSPSGGLVRGSGFDKEGTWTYTGQQIVFQVFGGGTAYTWSSLTKDPKRMRLHNSTWIADYIDANGGDGGGAGPGCSLGGTPYIPPSTPAVADAMIGSWMLCERPSPFGTSDELGIEFTSTGATKGEWFKLYATSTGIERGSGLEQRGSWYFPDSLDGSTTQLNIAISGRGEIHTFPSFTTSPRKMRIAGGTGPSATYANVVP